MYKNRSISTYDFTLSVGREGHKALNSKSAHLALVASCSGYDAYHETYSDEYLREAIDAMHQRGTVDNTNRPMRRF